jgi:hypothetical protein
MSARHLQGPDGGRRHGSALRCAKKANLLRAEFLVLFSSFGDRFSDEVPGMHAFCLPLLSLLVFGAAPVAPRPTTPSVAPPLDAAARDSRMLLLKVTAQREVSAEVVASLEQAFSSALAKLGGRTVRSLRDLETELGQERVRQLLGLDSAGAGLEGTPDLCEVTVRRDGARLLVVASLRTRLAVTTAPQVAVPADRPDAVLELPTTVLPTLFPAELAPGARPAGALPPSTRPLRVAVLDVRAVGAVPERALAAMNQSFSPELRKLEGVSGIAASELRDLLGLERQRQLLGCSEDTGCLTELAGAMDADELITVDLTLVGNTYAVSARRLDVKRSTVVGNQLQKVERRDGEELLALVGQLVAGLYPERGLKPGRTRGVEAALIRRLNPPPLPMAVFTVTSGVAAAAGVATLVTGLLVSDAQSEYRALSARSSNEPVAGADVLSSQRRLSSLALTTNVLLATFGGLALVSALEAFFTDWNGDRAALSLQLGPSGIAASLRGQW